MAQPNYAIKYLGSILVEKGKSYTSADVLTAYSTATCLKMANILNDKPSEGVKVSINKSPAFTTYIGEESYIETGLSYVFSIDCILAVGQYKAVS